MVALVKGDSRYDFGTKTEQDIKVATPQAKIDVQPDFRWEELLRLGELIGKT